MFQVHQDISLPQGTNLGDSSNICIKYAKGTNQRIFKSINLFPPLILILFINTRYK